MFCSDRHLLIRLAVLIAAVVWLGLVPGGAAVADWCCGSADVAAQCCETDEPATTPEQDGACGEECLSACCAPSAIASTFTAPAALDLSGATDNCPPELIMPERAHPERLVPPPEC